MRRRSQVDYRGNFRRMAIGVLTFCLGCVSTVMLVSCEQESPTGTLGNSVYGFAQKGSTGAGKFYYKDANPVAIEFVWLAEQPDIRVERIEFYLQFSEPYFDEDGSLRMAVHGGEKGRLYKVIEGDQVPRSNARIFLTLTQDDVFQLFKDVSFAYHSNQAVPVFGNPDQPARIPEGRFVAGDEFRLSWTIFTNKGMVERWPETVCKGKKEANCYFDWSVQCPLDITVFTGNYLCDEPGYQRYPVMLSRLHATSSTIVNNNFWNEHAPIRYAIDPATKSLTIPPQVFGFDGLSYSVTGDGEIDTCTGKMKVNYRITSSSGDILIEENVHTLTKVGG